MTMCYKIRWSLYFCASNLNMDSYTETKTLESTTKTYAVLLFMKYLKKHFMCSNEICTN